MRKPAHSNPLVKRAFLTFFQRPPLPHLLTVSEGDCSLAFGNPAPLAILMSGFLLKWLEERDEWLALLGESPAALDARPRALAPWRVTASMSGQKVRSANNHESRVIRQA